VFDGKGENGGDGRSVEEKEERKKRGGEVKEFMCPSAMSSDDWAKKMRGVEVGWARNGRWE
jgi:hypothetical protein